MTDTEWEVLAPLIEQCRPPHKTEHDDLRRTIEAIIWRHKNGAPWRAIPAELGPWWMAAQTFIRWGHLGVWERLLELMQAHGGVQLGMAFLDGTNIRAHHKAAGAVKNGRTPAQRDKDEGLGRSRGGFGTKACVLADASGRAIGFALAPGQAHELPLAPLLLTLLVAIPLWIVGDRGYASHAFREVHLEPRRPPGDPAQAQ
jgi:transposase